MPRSPRVSRRHFLQTTGAAAGGLAAASILGCHSSTSSIAAQQAQNGKSVRIQVDPEDPVVDSPPIQWALGFLRDTFAARGIAARIEPFGTAGAATKTLAVSGADARLARIMFDKTIGPARETEKRDAAVAAFRSAPESAILWRWTGDPDMFAAGRDPLGLVYALTEMADRVRLAPDPLAPFDEGSSLTESPANPYRGIVRLFVSETEDKRWFYDRPSWQQYLDMLVTHRFNHLNLSFGLSYDMSSNLTDTYTFFMYPFFLNVPGYKVRALAKNGQPLPADEQSKNLDTLKFISEQAALRGLKFTLGIWTHSCRWTNSPNATYTIDGLNAQSLPLYSRDALRTLIDALPSATGINLRTHGESGVTEGNYDFWKIIMAGLTGHKNPDGSPRTLELDLHGKSLTIPLIDIALDTGMPVTISCKLWAEHMGLPYMQASIREAEMPKERDNSGIMGMSYGTRSLLRYGIGDLLTKDRKYKLIHRVWPGTQKVLLWGDPAYAAEYGRTGRFAGIDGIDFFEPLSFRGRAGSSLNIPPAPDRSGYADASLRTPRDWEKYSYTFRLWGRLSYNPDAKPETWQRQLAHEFGAAAAPLENALANASRILPLVTTAHDCAAASDQYWPEMYANQSLHNTANCPYSEAPAPKVFGNIPSLDPQIFATSNDYADAVVSGKDTTRFVNPITVSNALARWAQTAIDDLVRAAQAIADPKAPAYRRLVLDTTIAAGLGQFFAHKFRAAIHWQLFNRTGHEPARAAALNHYKSARKAWASLADTAKVYLPNLTFGINPNLRGHWSDRLPAIDADIAGMTARPADSVGTAEQIARVADVVKSDFTRELVEPSNPPPAHQPSASFKPAQPLLVRLANAGAVSSARLWYRHVHQGQRYVALDMRKEGDTFATATFVAEIPAAYTDSPFPLQYYIEHSARRPGTLPGFNADFTGTPYYVVLPA